MNFKSSKITLLKFLILEAKRKADLSFLIISTQNENLWEL